MLQQHALPLQHHPLTRNALLVFASAVIVLATALYFQHGLGYVPCKLCMQQREGYYIAIPFAGLAAFSAGMKWPACLPRGLLAIAGLALVASALLGIYHAGAEWSFWQGPADCGVGAMGAPSDAGSLLDTLSASVPPSCTDAPWRMLGLSFAGWNVVFAGLIGIAAVVWAATTAYGSSGASQ